MNQCILMAEVLDAPRLRYTQDNQTAVAEMLVQFEGVKPEDPATRLKVVGWGNLAQEVQDRCKVGDRLILEGRLRMSTIERDGYKEKVAELTLARLHNMGANGVLETVAGVPNAQAAGAGGGARPAQVRPAATPVSPSQVYSAPAAPEYDDIPF
jgi:single-strand DNA-binding protein